MSDIWHTKDENPDANVGFACYRNLSHVENCTYLQNGGFQPTGSWAYIKDLLALETELERTRKALDYAKDKLDTVRQYHRRTAVIYPDDIAAYCDRAIDQITALEQKGHFADASKKVKQKERR